MHAIAGITRECLCRPDADALLARVYFRKYRFIEQNPMFSKVAYRHRSYCVTPLDN